MQSWHTFGIFSSSSHSRPEYMYEPTSPKPMIATPSRLYILLLRSIVERDSPADLARVVWVLARSSEEKSKEGNMLEGSVAGGAASGGGCEALGAIPGAVGIVVESTGLGGGPVRGELEPLTYDFADVLNSGLFTSVLRKATAGHGRIGGRPEKWAARNTHGRM